MWGMPDSQSHPRSSYNNVEDNVVHLACKVFNNDDFSSISEAKKSLLSRNQNENYQYLTNKKHGYLIHT